MPAPPSRPADAHEDARSASVPIPADEVLVELHRILESSTFRNAPRHRRFLEFTVSKTLAGEGDRIKEYVLGIEVFDRSPDFDPRSEPIVRAEARRLRARLSEYYSGDGRHDPILIDLPKGTYVPVFTRTNAGAQSPEPGAEPATSVRSSRRALVIGAILAVIIVGTSFVLRRLTRGSASAGSHSIAVLPFVNLSDQPGRQYLGDGVAEELTTRLAQLHDLRVVAATSAFQFRGKGEDVRLIGRELNAGTLLEGSIAGWPGRLRINAQLVSTSDGYHLWSKVYEVDADNILDAEEDIARETAKALRIPMIAGQHLGPAAHRTSNPEAHDLYLQGKYYFSKRDLPDMEHAASLFQAAIQKDANFALAYAALAQTLTVIGGNNQKPLAEVVPQAQAALKRSLELDPSLAEAYTTKALLDAEASGKRRGMEADFRHAIALDPNNATAHHWLGVILTGQSRFAESEAELRQAQLLDPLSPMITEGLAENYYYARRYDEAISQLEKLRANNFDSAPLLGLAYIQKHQYEQAIRLYTEMQQRQPGSGALTYLATAEAAAGKRDDALRTLHEAIAAKDFAMPYAAARVYAFLGDKDAAFHWLARATPMDPQFGGLLVDPMLDPIRSDPRYAALVKVLDSDS